MTEPMIQVTLPADKARTFVRTFTNSADPLIRSVATSIANALPYYRVEFTSDGHGGYWDVYVGQELDARARFNGAHADAEDHAHAYVEQLRTSMCPF